MRIHCDPKLVFTATLALLLCGLPAGLTLLVGQESNDLEAFRNLHRELNRRMDDDIEEATQFLESKIAESPDSADLNVLRHSLASRFTRARDFNNANTQFQKLLDFQINHVAQTENQFGIWMTVQSLQKVASESGNTTALEESVTRGLEALQNVDADKQLQTLIPMSQLSVLKAQLMVNDGKDDEANTLVQQLLRQLTDVNESDRASEKTMHVLVRMLRSLTTSDRGNDSWRDDCISKLDDVVSTAIEQYPESPAVQTDYAETQYMMISQWRQDDPKATKQRIDDVTEKLNLVATKNLSVHATLRRIEIYKERMDSAKPVSSLVGKPAPDWDIDAWVHDDQLSRESFNGKVVLLDFWAMWCGPCIATFPHLREWREEFADDNFEIVGVTQYYNFEWDTDAERASRSEQDVTAEQERETLASFLEHHKLDHPVIVTPKESKMGSEFGVRGIPHVVLVDRDGIVQLVKTGSGQATAEAIHAKIKELVKADVKN